ncbi:MAG: DUF501 domain-containing protein [Coriobacteriia bacterium]
MSVDAATVEAQIGRTPAASWRVAARCSKGHPTVIANSPRRDDGSPFPTLYWLTCPHLCEQVSKLESSGATDSWAKRVESDPHLAFELLAADQQYRAAREIEGMGDDPCSDVGIAGQRDPRATKCLHAHVATFLAGIPDPIGRDTVASVEPECRHDLCKALLECDTGPQSASEAAELRRR